MRSDKDLKFPIDLNRRRAIKFVLGTTTLPLWLSSCLEPTPQTLAIFHTNDWHSHFESSNNGLGGIARRATLINKLRKQFPLNILVDAGDFFQGTPYFNFYKGALEIEAMNKLGYDVVTLGNHEFDYGINNLAKQLQKAKFTVVNTNYLIKHEALKYIVKPWVIVRRRHFRVGFVGAGIDLKGLVPDDLWKGITYLDPISVVDSMAAELKRKRCNLVVCLSHLGYKKHGDRLSDIELAQNSRHIDIIIGGHSHTVLNPPEIVLNKDGEPVVIAQAGWAGHFVGKLIFSSKKPDSVEFSHGKIENI